jgi:signal transduction histidine kinase
VFTSRSLFDATLDGGPPARPEAAIWEGNGPSGPTRGIRQGIILDDGTVWTVDVAESLENLRAEQAALGRNVVVAFAFVGLLGVLGALLLVTAIMQPLGRLRRDLSRRMEIGSELSPGDYPEEVAPLVDEINDLLVRNQSVVERARRQSSDLAHALKTPSAALRNELESLAGKGKDTGAALEALARIDAQIGRSLARFRAESSSGTARLSTDLAHARDRIMRLFQRMPEAQSIAFDIVPSPPVRAAADSQDIEEIFGNLIENATKWARGRIRVSLSSTGPYVAIVIEDDGPGIPEEDRQHVLGSGYRLDTAKPGTGLGLAIVSDLVHAYGGNLDLGQSDDLGGLRVVAQLPQSEGTLSGGGDAASA